MQREHDEAKRVHNISIFVLQGEIRMRGKLLGIMVPLFTLLVAAVPAFAHHGFAVEFDGTKCADMSGTLTGIDWQNPHAYFHMDVKDASGKVSSWTFETLSVVSMKRGGMERQVFLDNIGKTLSTRACPAKSGTLNKAAAETLTLPDGKVYIVGQNVENTRGQQQP
jgi:hypothetical protein